MAATKISTLTGEALEEGQSTAIGSLPRTVLGSKVIVASIALLAGWAVAKLIQVDRRLRDIRKMEKRHNRTLKESFPASDPPASQYFDIPKNRQ
jgi:hypothetical protein